MANLSKGYSFGATETVTATKLHNLVDLGSVSGIVNADIAPGADIDATKLDLTSAGYTTSGGNFDITGLWNLNNVGGMKVASIASIAQARVSNLYGVNSFDTNLVVSSIASIASIRTASIGMPSTTVTDIKDEDNMASDSATSLATQRSVKAYVDTLVAAINSVDDYTTGTQDQTVGSALTERTTTETAYAKVKEITPLVRGGNVKIVWRHKVSGGTGNTKVYKNGVAAGAEKTTTATSDYEDVEEASVAVLAGDVIQIYAKVTASNTVYVDGMYVYADNPWVAVQATGY